MPNFVTALIVAILWFFGFGVLLTSFTSRWHCASPQIKAQIKDFIVMFAAAPIVMWSLLAIVWILIHGKITFT